MKHSSNNMRKRPRSPSLVNDDSILQLSNEDIRQVLLHCENDLMMDSSIQQILDARKSDHELSSEDELIRLLMKLSEDELNGLLVDGSLPAENVDTSQDAKGMELSANELIGLLEDGPLPQQNVEIDKDDEELRNITPYNPGSEVTSTYNLRSRVTPNSVTPSTIGSLTPRLDCNEIENSCSGNAMQVD